MARMPEAQWVGPRHDNGVMTRWDILCAHTIVGYPPAHAAHFSTGPNGEIWQSRDTAYRSAANYNGNHRVISVENGDHGPAYGAWNTRDGHAVPGFTDAQMWALAKIIVWAHRTHGIPIQLCPDSRPGSRGIAYHRQGCDSPNNFAGYAYKGRVSGGEVWSTSVGKVCPGDRRIKQLIEIIIPRAKQLAAGGPLKEDDEMASWLDEPSGVGYTRPDGTTGEHTMRGLEAGNNKAHWENHKQLEKLNETMLRVVDYLGQVGQKLDIVNQKLDAANQPPDGS